MGLEGGDDVAAVDHYPPTVRLTTPLAQVFPHVAVAQVPEVLHELGENSVAARAGECGVEAVAESVVEPEVRVDHGHLLHEAPQASDFARRGHDCGARGELRLYELAGLELLERPRPRVGIAAPRKPAAPVGDVSDVRAVAGAHLDDAGSLEGDHGLADGRTADAEEACQLALGRELCAAGQAALHDQRSDLIGNDLVDPTGTGIRFR